MFWDAVADGLGVLTYWQTYVAGALYLVLTLGPAVAAGSMLERGGAAGGMGGCLSMLLMPLLQAVAVAILVLTLSPIILGISDNAAWGLPWFLMVEAPWFFLKLCAFLLVAAVLLAFVPVLGRIQSLHTLLLGAIVLAAAIGILNSVYPEINASDIDRTPGFIFVVALLIFSGAMTWLGMLVAAGLATALDLATRGLGQAALLPIVAVFGFVPVFIYGAWLGNQLPDRLFDRASEATLLQPAPAASLPPAAPPAEPSTSQSQPVTQKAEPIVQLEGLPEAERLSVAFEAAFGQRGSADITMPVGTDYSQVVRYTPGLLIDTSAGPILVSEGRVLDEDGGDLPAHAAEGQIAIHYFSGSTAGYRVVKGFLPALETGTFGRVSRWKILDENVGSHPVLFVEGGGAWQGYNCGWAHLVEIAPSGPIELVFLPLMYDDGGAREPATEITGTIGNFVFNESFDVTYTGTRAFVEHYVRSGNRYSLVGGGDSQLPRC